MAMQGRLHVHPYNFSQNLLVFMIRLEKKW